MIKQNLDFKVTREFFIKLTIIQFRIILKKNAGMSDFVILDIDLVLNR